MLKGVLIAFLVVLVFPVIPLVHFLYPFSPFIAGYIGIGVVGGYPPGAAGRKALVFGLAFGAWMLVALAAAAAIVTILVDFGYVWLMWGGVAVFTGYFGSMAGLGAWYAELRRQNR